MKKDSDRSQGLIEKLNLSDSEKDRVRELSRKVGRPTKYRKAFCSQLVEHMSEGYSFESFVSVIGVNRDTLYRWCKEKKEFSDSKKLGTELNLRFWEKVGIDLALGRIKGNTAAWIFNMKNRHSDLFKERQEIVQEIGEGTKSLLESVVNKSIENKPLTIEVESREVDLKES